MEVNDMQAMLHKAITKLSRRKKKQKLLQISKKRRKQEEGRSLSRIRPKPLPFRSMEKGRMRRRAVEARGRATGAGPEEGAD
jgi:hypothetical protein